MAKTFKRITFICILVNLASIAIILSLKNHLPPVVPLLYGLPVSTTELVPNTFLIIPPIVTAVLALINFSLTKTLRDIFLQKIFSGLNITLTTLSIITVIKIALLVGSFS